MKDEQTPEQWAAADMLNVSIDGRWSKRTLAYILERETIAANQADAYQEGLVASMSVAEVDIFEAEMQVEAQHRAADEIAVVPDFDIWLGETRYRAGIAVTIPYELAHRFFLHGKVHRAVGV